MPAEVLLLLIILFLIGLVVFNVAFIFSEYCDFYDFFAFFCVVDLVPLILVICGIFWFSYSSVKPLEVEKVEHFKIQNVKDSSGNDFQIITDDSIINVNKLFGRPFKETETIEKTTFKEWYLYLYWKQRPKYEVQVKEETK